MGCLLRLLRLPNWHIANNNDERHLITVINGNDKESNTDFHKAAAVTQLSSYLKCRIDNLNWIMHVINN